MDNTPRLGRVVQSRAGRDKDRYYMIVGIESESVVFLADGALRRLEKPKRKKLKHLALKPQTAEAIGEKLKAGSKVFDAEIKSALMGFADKNREEQAAQSD